METFFKSGHGISPTIINYLENDEKIQLACTCTGMNEQVLHGKGIEVPVDPRIVVSVSPLDSNAEDSHRGNRFLQNMNAHLQDERKKNILQNHYRVKIEQVCRFIVTAQFFRSTVTGNTAKMRSITELDISLPTPTHCYPTIGVGGRFIREGAAQSAAQMYKVGSITEFLELLTIMFPNLRKINLTNIRLHHNTNLANFCPHLETIIWKTTTRCGGYCVRADGGYFASFHNLKDITLDNRCFFFNSNQRRDMADRTNTTKFLFHKCIRNNTKLARVSMKNVCFNVSGRHYDRTTPQHVFMKFVRNVPSLTYFRSDLTPENIAILQLERPAMVFE